MDPISLHFAYKQHFFQSKMGAAYSEADGSSLTRRKPSHPLSFSASFILWLGYQAFMAADRAVGLPLILHPTNVFVQESLVTSLWRLKVHGAAERSAGFHEVDTSEPKREENQILSVIS